MAGNRFCVFCGRPPEEKNREHVLPYWLLEMTGDPTRVVNLGTHFKSNKTIRFSWSSLVMPSCQACNNSYSELEGEVKPIVEALTRRETLPAAAYLPLLDWLDKVRVGLWLAYHVLQGNPTEIQPTFHIDSRVGVKDRMVALYPMDTDNVGLNAYGVESLLFHRTPSCFGLRVNNLLMLNISADFLVAGRCGFPHPRGRQLLIDGPTVGALLLSDFVATRRIMHPLLRRVIHKPSVHLYQPIMQRAEPAGGTGFLGEPSTLDSFLAEHTIGPYLSGEGVLFRQYLDRVEAITDLDAPVAFGLIEGLECRTMYQLAAQVYELQSYVQDLFPPHAADPKLLKVYRKAMKHLQDYNRRVSNFLLAQPGARPPRG